MYIVQVSAAKDWTTGIYRVDSGSLIGDSKEADVVRGRVTMPPRSGSMDDERPPPPGREGTACGHGDAR